MKKTLLLLAAVAGFFSLAHALDLRPTVATSIGNAVSGAAANAVLFTDANGNLTQDTANLAYSTATKTLNVSTLTVTNGFTGRTNGLPSVNNGIIGQRVSSFTVAGTFFAISPQTPGAQWTDGPSITLTPGDWDISAQVVAQNLLSNGQFFDLEVGISTDTGNNFFDVLWGYNDVRRQIDQSFADNAQWDIETMAVSLSTVTTATQTFRIKAIADWANGSNFAPHGFGKIEARRRS